MGVDLVEVVGGQCRLSYGFVKARLKYSDGRENTWDKIPQQDYIKKKKTCKIGLVLFGQKHSFLHCFQPVCTDFFNTFFLQSLLLWTLSTQKSSILFMLLPQSVHLGHSLPHTRVLPYSHLHVSPPQGMSCPPLQITVSYANVIAHKEPCLTSSVSLSISITNKQGAQGQTLMPFYLHLELFCHT